MDYNSLIATNFWALAISLVASMQSMTNASSMYHANIDQLISGSFSVVFSDIIGVISLIVILSNLVLALKRHKKPDK